MLLPTSILATGRDTHGFCPTCVSLAKAGPVSVASCVWFLVLAPKLTQKPGLVLVSKPQCKGGREFTATQAVFRKFDGEVLTSDLHVHSRKGGMIVRGLLKPVKISSLSSDPKLFVGFVWDKWGEAPEKATVPHSYPPTSSSAVKGATSPLPTTSRISASRPMHLLPSATSGSSLVSVRMITW